VHAGAAVSRDAAEEARDEQGRNPRYRWLGDLPPSLTRDLLVRSQLLVAVSPREGRLNVLAEALSAGVSIVAARGPGSITLLGEEYPGLVAPGNTAALTDLLLRAEFEPAFYGSLLEVVSARRAIVDPALERDAWRRLIEEVAGSSR
jgi:glycosyltransferase involved in cell wall biosynthesis